MTFKIQMYLLATALTTCLGFGVWYNYKTKKELKEKLEIAELNNKAFMATNLAYKQEYEELEASKLKVDSLLIATTKELKIKPKKVKELFYVKDTLYKHDTVTIKQIPKEVVIDTLMGDSLLSNRLQINKSLVSITTKITNEKILIVDEYRAYLIDKGWFWNLFQRKRLFLRVNVKNTNPHIKEVDKKLIYLTK